MKTIHFIIYFNLLALGSVAQISNGSFENWHIYSLGEQPDNWSTSDSIAAALGGGNNVFKGTDSYDGLYSMHLLTVLTQIGVKVPGIATNGLIGYVGSSAVFSGGMPYTNRPAILSGFYKYSPAYMPFTTSLIYTGNPDNPDTCLISIQSSRGIDDPDAGIGTELIIDSLFFSGTVGIEEKNEKFNSVNVFPSPAYNHITIQFTN